MKFDQDEGIDLLSRFTGPDLTNTLLRIEDAARGVTATGCEAFLDGSGVRLDVLAAAAELKRQAGQINVTIHALGILLCLPHILEPGERVEYVSLGAGNTGRQFDLETNVRVAEFKFIRWRGGAETIRQNSIFKDFVLLADSPTPKQKYLYLLGTHHAMKFLNGRRALTSVLSHNDKLRTVFFGRFGAQFKTVRDYHAVHGGAVRIEDVSPWLSELTGNLDEGPTDEFIEERAEGGRRPGPGSASR